MQPLCCGVAAEKCCAWRYRCILNCLVGRVGGVVGLPIRGCPLGGFKCALPPKRSTVPNQKFVHLNPRAPCVKPPEAYPPMRKSGFMEPTTIH